MEATHSSTRLPRLPSAAGSVPDRWFELRYLQATKKARDSSLIVRSERQLFLEEIELSDEQKRMPADQRRRTHKLDRLSMLPSASGSVPFSWFDERSLQAAGTARVCCLVVGGHCKHKTSELLREKSQLDINLLVSQIRQTVEVFKRGRQRSIQLVEGKVPASGGHNTELSLVMQHARQLLRDKALC